MAINTGLSLVAEVMTVADLRNEFEDLADLRNELEDLALQRGVCVFGVADLVPVRDVIVEQGGEWLAAFPRAVSFGVSWATGIVDQMPRHKSINLALTYDIWLDTMSAYLDDISLRLSFVLERAGYRTVPIPASQTLDAEKQIGLVSHKLVARRAGLGWIGKNALLISPGFGPRLRLGSILTDAPLVAGTPMEERCGDCTACVNACPPRALKNRNFDPGEPREMRVDIHMCEAYRKHLKKNVTGVQACGMCIYSCPYGKRD